MHPPASVQSNYPPSFLTWDALGEEVAPGAVGGIDKEREPEPDELDEGQARREEAVPVEVAEGEEGLEEVPGLTNEGGDR